MNYTIEESSKRAYILRLKDGRYYSRFKKSLVTAWSLAGAKFFRADDLAELEEAEEILKDRNREFNRILLEVIEPWAEVSAVSIMESYHLPKKQICELAGVSYGNYRKYKSLGRKMGESSNKKLMDALRKYIQAIQRLEPLE